ncbi:hypothetical protein UlMin_027867 [Ulmus minor]
MISTSFFAHASKAKTLNPLFFRFLFSPTIRIQNQSSSSSSPIQKNPEIPARLNHKDWLSPNEVLQLFSNVRDPKSVIEAFDHYSKRKDFKPNEALYTLIINKLAQARFFDAIDDLLRRIRAERKCRLSDEFFRNVIKIYGNVGGRIDKAMETLFDMPIYECWPSVKTFNFVLNLLVSAKLFDVVHELYLAAPKLGIEIDACCLNILVKGLCEWRKLDDALHLLDEFPQQKCARNALTFSTLMHGLCVHGKVEEAFGLFKRMEEEDIDPDTITFNILIGGLRKQGRIDDGIALLEKMKRKGCAPNAGSYQEVLYGLLDAKRYIEAKEFTREIISKGVSPSFKSYKCLVQGLCEENLMEDVDWVLKQMARQGFVPKMGMWKVIVQSLFGRKSRQNYVSCEEIIQL